MSLVPLVTGAADSVRDEVFAEVNWHAFAEPTRSVRTGRYKYIRRFYPRAGSDNCDSSVSRTLLCEKGWNDRSAPRECLFDLVFDPNEANNVAADPAYADVLADLQKRLERWMQETADPVLSGQLVPTPGLMTSPDSDKGPRGTLIPATAVILE
jgi:hypothetical protein